MNKDLFLQHIENDRNCEGEILDIAVNRGLKKAKNDRVDEKKLFMLAAAGIFILAICINISLMPFSAVTERYYENRQKIMPGCSQILDSYIKNIVNNFVKYSGGE